jgi:putative addiction module antidote
MPSLTGHRCKRMSEGGVGFSSVLGIVDEGLHWVATRAKRLPVGAGHPAEDHDEIEVRVRGVHDAGDSTPPTTAPVGCRSPLVSANLAAALHCRAGARANVARMCYCGDGVDVTKEVTLRQAGGSVSATLPKDMADRLHLEAGDRVLAVETDRGILLTPYDPDVERALMVAAKAAKKYRNALRELAK